MIKICFHAKNLNDAFDKGDHKKLAKIKANKDDRTTEIITVDNTNMMPKAESLVQMSLGYLLNTKVISGKNITWPSMVYQEHQAMTSGFTDSSFYNGTFGILLAFSYGYKLLSEADYKNTADKCISSFNEDLNKQEDSFFAGGWSGLGGSLFALCQLYKLEKNPQTKDLIKTLLAKSDDAIKHDNAYDIIGGSCGLIPALIKVNKTFALDIDENINKAVSHILKRCKTPAKFYPKPVKAENIIQEKPKAQLGFAHGMAGAAWAMLLSLPYLQDDLQTKAKTWITQVIDYLDAKYNKKDGFWPDFRESCNNQKGPHWCAGHVGIGHFYLALFKNNWPDKRIEDRLKTVIQMAKKDINQKQPHINHCCGVYGDLDLLMSIKEQLPDWSAQYITDPDLTNMQARIIAHIEHRGAPRYDQEDHSSFIAGLFQGHAGVAYILMRIMAPKVVPSVLGWDVSS